MTDPAPQPKAQSANTPPAIVTDLVELMAAWSTRFRARMARLAFGVIAAAIGLLILAATACVAVVMLFSGVAGGLGTLLGGRPWLGAIITGAVALGTVFVVLRVAAGRIARRTASTDAAVNALRTHFSREHPYAPLAAAAVGGFTAAAIVVPQRPTAPVSGGRRNRPLMDLFWQATALLNPAVLEAVVNFLTPATPDTTATNETTPPNASTSVHMETPGAS